MYDITKQCRNPNVKIAFNFEVAYFETSVILSGIMSVCSPILNIIYVFLLFWYFILVCIGVAYIIMFRKIIVLP